MKLHPWGGHIARTTAGEVLASSGVPAGPATVGEGLTGVLREAGRLAVRAQLAAGATGLLEAGDVAAREGPAQERVDDVSSGPGAGMPSTLGLVQDAELEETLDLVAHAQARLGATRLGVACEVAARGLHSDAGFLLPDWLQRCPDLDAPVTRDLSRLALASREVVHQPLVASVLRRDAPGAGGPDPPRACPRPQSHR